MKLIWGYFFGETSDFQTITKPMLFLLNSSYLFIVENIHLRWSPKTKDDLVGFAGLPMG